MNSSPFYLVNTDDSSLNLFQLNSDKEVNEA